MQTLITESLPPVANKFNFQLQTAWRHDRNVGAIASIDSEQNITRNRPALSCWHTEHKAAFERFLSEEAPMVVES